MGLDFDESDEEEAEEDEDVIKKEIKAYRCEPALVKDEDPLDWWESQERPVPQYDKTREEVPLHPCHQHPG